MPFSSYRNKLIAQAVDFFTVILSFTVAYILWRVLNPLYPKFLGHIFLIGYLERIVVIYAAITWVLILNYYLKAYDHRRFTSIQTEIKNVIKTSLLGELVVIASVFILRIPYIPRALIIICFIITVIALILEKMLLFCVARKVRHSGHNLKRTIIVGTGNQARQLIKIIENHRGWGLEIIGIVKSDDQNEEQSFCDYPILSNIDDIPKVLKDTIVDEIIITSSTKQFDQIRKVIGLCQEEGIQVRLITDFFGSISKKIKIDHVYGLPIISILNTPENNGQLLIKRIIDFCVSAILLVLLSPLFLIVSILIKFTSKGPVFYQWKVIGYNKRPISSWKFRTMVQDADQKKESLLKENEMNGPVFKMKNDPRVTTIGRFLRKYSIDEIPQLLSVLKGDLSLVGPRPAFPDELARYENWHRRKLSIKPGITCLWQVNGRNEITDFNKWVKLDLEYIDNWSLWLDFKIFLKTIKVVITGHGAS